MFRNFFIRFGHIVDKLGYTSIYSKSEAVRTGSTALGGILLTIFCLILFSPVIVLFLLADYLPNQHDLLTNIGLVIGCIMLVVICLLILVLVVVGIGRSIKNRNAIRNFSKKNPRR